MLSGPRPHAPAIDNLRDVPQTRRGNVFEQTNQLRAHERQTMPGHLSEAEDIPDAPMKSHRRELTIGLLDHKERRPCRVAPRTRAPGKNHCPGLPLEMESGSRLSEQRPPARLSQEHTLRSGRMNTNLTNDVPCAQRSRSPAAREWNAVCLLENGHAFVELQHGGRERPRMKVRPSAFYGSTEPVRERRAALRPRLVRNAQPTRACS